VLDPPRSGCHPAALQALALMRVPRLVYVSCSPPTLARDLRLLHDLGYRTTAVQPLDMFSQTYHIECVTTLHRGSYGLGADQLRWQDIDKGHVWTS
jgi:23S rRNA (uracil1939-C5)-methyltransferase